MPLVEEDHEHALRPVVGRARVLAEDRAAGVVRDQVELFDLLRLAVFENQDVLGAKAGGKLPLLVEDDGVDFDEGGRRPEHPLATGRRGILALQRRTDRDQQKERDDGAGQESRG